MNLNRQQRTKGHIIFLLLLSYCFDSVKCKNDLCTPVSLCTLQHVILIHLHKVNKDSN